MSTRIKREALKEVGVEALKQTAMQSLNKRSRGLQLFEKFQLIDNSWSVAIERADKAGIILAETLALRTQGTDPCPSWDTRLAHVLYTHVC